MDYEINWTNLNSSTVEELPLTEDLSRFDHGTFSTFLDGKLKLQHLFLSRRHQNKAENHLDLTRTGQGINEDFLIALKSSPQYYLGGFISIFDFPRFTPQLENITSSILPDGISVTKMIVK
ncbi:hypothetical protein G6F37_002028 [Rhizopus arrhizus]|nr:hypothetical protein G6F38_001816 [Rhizopus arrhizus]KAG1162560.1 hypothetical protein G6F37_002028 [Rhizopus arrhizus]